MSSKARTSLTSADAAARIGAGAKAAIEERIQRLHRQRRDRDARNARSHAVTEALLRTVAGPSGLGTAYPPGTPDFRDILRSMDICDKSLARESPTMRDLTLNSVSNARAPAYSEDIQGGNRSAAGNRLEILVPPYVDGWISTSRGDNGEATAWADPATGVFGFIQGAAGGWASSGAGVWVQFEPDEPNRVIQIRSYTPYDYQWDDASNNGYTAHCNGGFGVYVLSWDPNGNDQTLEQDYRYDAWSDGTGWYEEHSNPSWDGSDSDYAYVYGHEPPWFESRAGRIYRACIWCFGSCDAGSGFFGNSMSAEDIRARAGFVVIDER